MKTYAQAHQTEGTSALRLSNPKPVSANCRMIGVSEALAKNPRLETPAAKFQVTRFEKPVCKKPTQLEIVIAFAIGCFISFAPFFIF